MSNEEESGILHAVAAELKKLRDMVEESQLGKERRPSLFAETDPPFTRRILDHCMSSCFQTPLVTLYTGDSDPLNHVRAYKDWMSLHSHQDEAKSKAFSLTLSGVAQTWYGKLQPGSIDLFKELGSKFVSHFKAGQVKAWSTDFLFFIHQQVRESLISYANYFHAETLSVSNFEDQIALAAFRWGLLPGNPGTFPYKMARKPYETYAEAHEAALQYGNADESKLQKVEARLPVEDRPSVQRHDRRESKRYRRDRQRQCNDERPRPLLLEIVH